MELRVVSLQPVQVGFVVVIRAKRRSCLVAADDDVIEQSRGRIPLGGGP